jgi:hypothetical protein
MRTPIWIEPVKWPDLRKLYTTERRGLLLMTRFWQPGWRDTRRGSAQRGLRGVSCPQSRGIVGPFETRKFGLDYPHDHQHREGGRLDCLRAG